jgi:hypothetical protein
MPDHVRFSVDLDLDAPKIMIPAKIARTGGDDTQLLLDLGHFTLHTAHVSGTPCVTSNSDMEFESWLVQLCVC